MKPEITLNVEAAEKMLLEQIDEHRRRVKASNILRDPKSVDKNLAKLRKLKRRLAEERTPLLFQ